jgi:DNA (cytosine-5)-methyltransferase 1
VNFYEFFAGGGFVRLGLGDAWRCLFANDIDPAKTRAYRRNFGAGELRCGDIGRLECTDLPSQADLAWASFPCQDLSAAGLGAGLSGARSGLFWEFSRLIEGLSAAGRAPSMLAIENVLGTTTARNGRDLEIICQSLSQAGYRFGPLVVDASLFVPQSRPRLFIIALRDGMAIPDGLAGSKPSSAWHPAALRRIYAQLEPAEARRWIWWKPRYPRGRIGGLETLLETAPNDVIWHSSQETERLLDMMSDDARENVRRARCDGAPVIGCAYVRTPGRRKAARSTSVLKFGLTAWPDACGRLAAARADKSPCSSMASASARVFSHVSLSQLASFARRLAGRVDLRRRHIFLDDRLELSRLADLLDESVDIVAHFRVALRRRWRGRRRRAAAVRR